MKTLIYSKMDLKLSEYFHFYPPPSFSASIVYWLIPNCIAMWLSIIILVVKKNRCSYIAYKENVWKKKLV